MKKILVFSLCFLGILFSIQAQKFTLLADFSFNKNGKEKEGYYKDFNLVNTSFKDGGVYTEGNLGEFEKNQGNAIWGSRMSNLYAHNCSVSLSFKIENIEKDMPIFVIGAYQKPVGVYIKNGVIYIEINNGKTTYQAKNTPLKPNKWYNIVLISANQTLELYLNKEKILSENRVNVTEIDPKKNSIQIVSFSPQKESGFIGYWKNLKVYEGVYDLSDVNSNVVIEPNNNPVIEPNNNPVINPNNNNTNTETALGTWKKINIDTKGNVNKEKYNLSRQHFLSKNKENGLNIIWQDSKTQKIYLSVLQKNMAIQNPIPLSIPANTKILAATNDEADNLYVMVFNEFKEDKNTNDFITLYKLSNKGNLLAQKKHSSAEKDLNIFRVGYYGGILVHSAGTLGFFMGRTMNKSDDGLNHQGGIGVTFDANSLDIIKNTGQTSGHSFDNYLTKNEAGDFIGIDLGDNYPRGINLHRMTKQDRAAKLVYAFKTEHGTTANGYGTIYPKYEEISTPKKSFYKWSNDNGVYTELGGVVEVSDGYLVIFAGEPDAQGKALNSSRIGDNLDARNLGFVKVSKDFYDYTKYPYQSYNHIISTGINEKGGFYTFGGTWCAQENKGVNWLTKYKDKAKENARNIKIQKLPNGNILILWSITTGDYWNATTLNTMMMCIDKYGKIVQNPIAIAKDIDLNRRDEIILIDNKVFSVQGKDSILQINYLELK